MEVIKSTLLSAAEAWNSTEGPYHSRHGALSHWSFYWGYKCVVLFSGWPGTSKSMYALAIIFVFVLAILVECFANCKIVKPGANRVAAGFMKAGLHGVRAGLTYMLMLAVMSFNGGIFIAAVIGHAAGHVIFGSQIFEKSDV